MQDLFTDTRLPKIVVTREGSVLAFARGCRVMRRSEDQGETWSPVRDVNAKGNGNVVVDRTTGDVLIVRPLEACLWRSRDDGKTWKREAITLKPNKIGHGTPDGVPVGDVSACESGITLQHGEHKGRLVMPVRVQLHRSDRFQEDRQEYWQYHYNTSIYSDDGGATWQVGEPVQSGTGEGTLAELSDGRIYYNSRCHMAVDGRRRIAWSYDGGYRWVDWHLSDELFEVGGPAYFKYGRRPSYGCNAGLVRVPAGAAEEPDVLLYSAPDNPGATSPHSGRVRMTVWMSTDGARNWPHKRLVYEGPSAYSSLAADEHGNVYLLFERGESELYQSITLARFDVDWVRR
ncbi:MAG: sialidase family protein [Candidatus Brocadiia bacterium]